jgi:hypothetical protein
MRKGTFALVFVALLASESADAADCERLQGNAADWMNCVQTELVSAAGEISELRAKLSRAESKLSGLETRILEDQKRGLPVGLIAYFDKECPVGWARYFPLTGRYVVGAHEEISIGAQVGEPMGDLEKRVSGAHSHSMVSHTIAHPDWSIPKTKSISGLATQFRSPNDYSVYIWEVNWPISEAGKGDTAAPYVQLRACLYKGG